MKLEELNKYRKGDTFKKPEDENFLKGLNETLYQKEKSWYQNRELQYPLIFVFGLPRSGTTLTAQVLTHGLNLNYINNIAARFYLAPLHGIKLANAIVSQKSSEFKSDHAHTSNLADIHEFGYFWRHHLHKNGLLAATELEQTEAKIDWNNLKLVLANMLHYWQGPALFKNIFGAYHMSKLTREIPNSLFVYIERPPADVGMSIFKARKKFYGPNSEKWWSTAPPEIKSLLNAPVEKQIAGQVYFLRQFYEQQMKESPAKNYIRLNYEELTETPRSCLIKVSEHLSKSGFEINVNTEAVPEKFENRRYDGNHAFLKKFEAEYQKFNSGINA